MRGCCKYGVRVIHGKVRTYVIQILQRDLSSSYIDFVVSYRFVDSVGIEAPEHETYIEGRESRRIWMTAIKHDLANTSACLVLLMLKGATIPADFQDLAAEEVYERGHLRSVNVAIISGGDIVGAVRIDVAIE